MGQFIAVDGRGLWRLSMVTPELITDTEGFDAHTHIRRALGSDDIDYELKSILPWERHRRVANRYHVGRVFLAGDAVHQYSPTGGLGMNTGIQEAVDVAWKLAAVLNGWGGEQLLDSYFPDRQPVAIRNNVEATANFKKLVELPSGPAIDADTPEGDTLRTEAKHVIETGGYNEEYEQEGVTVGYRYDRSPICVDDGSGFPPLTRLPQLGGHEAANPLIFGHWNIKGRHYRAPTGCGGWPSVRLGSAALAVAAMSCRVGSAEVRASCSAGCGAAGRGVGRRWSAGGHPPSGWWRTPR